MNNSLDVNTNKESKATNVQDNLNIFNNVGVLGGFFFNIPIDKFFDF